MGDLEEFLFKTKETDDERKSREAARDAFNVQQESIKAQQDALLALERGEGVEDAANREGEAQKRRKGRKSTILAGAKTKLGDQNLERKQLLGEA